MRSHKTRSTCEKYPTQLAKMRWGSTKSSISQLTFYLFYNIVHWIQMDGSRVIGNAYRLLPSRIYCGCGNGHWWTRFTTCCGGNPIDTFHSPLPPTIISIDRHLPSWLQPTIYIDGHLRSLLPPKISTDRHLPQSIAADNIYRWTPSTVYCRRQYLSIDTFPILLPTTISIDSLLPPTVYFDGHCHNLLPTTIPIDRCLQQSIADDSFYR